MPINNPLRSGTGAVQAVSMQQPAAATPATGGGGGGLTIATTTAGAKPATPGPQVVFPAWLKWLLIAGGAYILYKKVSGKRGGSLGSLLEPRRRERKLREFHITEEGD